MKFIFQHADTSPQSSTFRIYAKNIEEKKLELPNSYTEIRTTSACKSEWPQSNDIAVNVAITSI